ncbi:helix-turn-helix domain-containing protein [Kitasatospora purpeofusca]|uniref:helix-turn-helix domain-containing protein n=1 Tax=Kitasatospora purpeofusca TaxID=67352 RepID=UPI0036B12AF3
MQIHRIPKHSPGYTILDNGVIRKHSLSWAARGLLGYLLSLPDGTREDVRTLAAKSVEGRTTVSRALAELERAGHYIRRREHDPITGQVRTHVSVHEAPVASKVLHTLPPLPASPAAGEPGAGTPDVGKAGAPSGITTSLGNNLEPSVRPVTDLFTDDPDLMTPADPEEMAEAQAAVWGALGGSDGDVVDEPETVPQEPATGREELPLHRPRPAMTDGLRLLVELGRREPRMTLSGKPLTDQSAMVEGLLAGGWHREDLLRILSAPLPEKITRSVGAIISARLSKIPAVPIVPTEGAPLTSAPAGRSRPRTNECSGNGGLCGRPVSTAGGLCTTCRD